MSEPPDTRAPAEGTAGPIERFDPETLHGELIEAEHLLRYYWAARLAHAREVLDAGCGTGYGCRVLVEVGGAGRCIGVDLADDAIGRARDRYGRPDGRIEFQTGNLTDLSFEDASFDLITCFETIEHLSAADQERLVSELRRVLRPEGLLLVSSPNRGQYPPGNPFHVRELTPEELRDLLGGQFDDVQLVRQHNWLASVALDDETFARSDADRPVEAELRKVEGREPGRELYTLAICGDRPVEHAGELVLTDGLEVRRWLDALEQRREELERVSSELLRTRQALAESERQLLELRERRSSEMARLERQAYWLERAEVDLDALMRLRPVRLALRVLRALVRLSRRLTGQRR